jgi:hypothetical protein
VTPPRDRRGGGHVLVVVQRRGVEHHRRDAEFHGLDDQVPADGMVEVQHDRRGRPVGDPQAGERQRRQRAVECDSVLGDLQHDGTAGGPGPGHDRLGVLKLDHVERGETARPGARYRLGHGDEGHVRRPP